MIKIQIILGSTRPRRIGPGVANWVLEEAKKRTDFEVELVDVTDYNLPLLDEPVPALMNQYSKDHTKKWAAKIAEADGYLFVTAEYNRALPGALKNAMDFLNKEWNNKAAAIVSYGTSALGQRAADNLRLVMSELRMADIRSTLGFSIYTDFENFSNFKPPAQHHIDQLNELFDELVAWSTAMKTLRS